MQALNGVAMELDDCAFPAPQADMVMSDDPAVAFDGVNWALLSARGLRYQRHGT